MPIGPRPLITVIVASHNAEQTLPAAIASVRAQTLENWELIVVDDASSCADFDLATQAAQQDTRIRVIQLADNQGPAGARNAALDIAKGEWIAVLDADDEYLPDRLQILSDNAHAADLVVDNLLRRIEDDPDADALAFAPEALSDPGFWAPEQLIFSDIPRNGKTSFGYLKPMIRKGFMDEKRLRYDDSLRVAEDSNLYLRLILAGARVASIPAAHYIYKLGPDSITRDENRFLFNLREVLRSNTLLSQSELLARAPAAQAALKHQAQELDGLINIGLLKQALRRRQPGGIVRHGCGLFRHWRVSSRSIVNALMRRISPQMTPEAVIARHAPAVAPGTQD